MSDQTETKNLIDELTVSDDFNIGLTGEQIFSQHHISAKKPTETEWFRVYGSNIDELKKGVLCKVKVGFKDEDFIIGGDNKFKKRVEHDFKKVRKVLLCLLCHFTGTNGYLACHYSCWKITFK